TDTAVEICSANIQVHGGMGFIEETGAAQHYRDARITPIYEGANGVQALDLVGRKVARDGGEAMRALLADIDATLDALAGVSDLAAVRDRLGAGRDALGRAAEWVVATMPKDPAAAASGSALFLRLAGLVTGGWLSARAALAARGAGDADRWLDAKVV